MQSILWFLPSITDLEGRQSSNHASARIRCLEMFPWFKEHFDTDLISLEPIQLQLDADQLNRCDIVVFGKIFRDVSAVMGYLKSQGKKIILDICDPIFDDKAHRRVYLPILKYVDVFVTATASLQHHLAENGITSITIEDCIETRPLPPAYGTAPLNHSLFVWFGSSKNRGEIDVTLHFLATLSQERHLVIVTRFSTDEQEDHVRKLASQLNVDITVLPWSQANQEHAISACDAVILPSENMHSSHNRLTTVLLAGKWGICHPVTAFRPFDAYCSQGALQDAFEHYRSLSADHLNQQIISGQKMITEHYSPHDISKRWIELLNR